ncbi:hypothetical protein [Ancylobacter sp.]|uniref:COG3904 family protein n=1 Tax=Ancylobacter sp. TaxID=1872567 RepID=UPI003D1343EB
MSEAAQSAPARWRRLLGDRPDETLLRALFRALVGITVAVLAFDMYERMNAPPPPREQLLPGEVPQVEPFLPSSRPNLDPAEQERGRPTPDGLREAMRIELAADGRLTATGTITPGTAERFAAEVERRGSYVKTVVLNSPGGSVQDALAMGRLIRDKGFATEVGADAHCASSCPLVFAGGVKRVARKGASIGVHQVFAVSAQGNAADTGMADAQRVSAECQRHLVAMGVDPRVWIHAMETPPKRLFYFSPEELTELKLATAP